METEYDYDIEYDIKKQGIIDVNDKDAYANIKLAQQQVKQILENEENNFDNNIEYSLPIQDEIKPKKEETKEISITDVTTKVNVGEKCTIKFAKKQNIFDNKNYLINLNDNELENINVYNTSLNDNKKYNICHIKDSIAYENCALATGNPYLSLNYDKTTKKHFCSIPDDISLPKNNRYAMEYNTSNILRPNTEIYFKNKKIGFCEERWHDWFCIPNFHLNNRWVNEKPSELESTKSVGKCLMPCKFGYVPTDENIGKCVLKNQYNGGAYADDFDYNPLALICLLGTTFDSFLNEDKGGYIQYMKNIQKNVLADTSIEFLHNNNDNKDIMEYILANIKTENGPIWTNVKQDIQKYISEMFTNIPDINNEFIDLNITAPSDSIIDMMNRYITKNRILYAYGIAKNINDMLTMDIDKYKEWRHKLKTMSNLSDDKFVYLVRILKRACNICFDGNSKFSINFLLFTINKDDEAAYPPIKIDEKYDPFDDDIIINDFTIIKKKKRGLFDDYISDFQSYENSTYTFLYFIAVVLILFVIFVIYIVFYSRVNMVFNSIFTFIVFLYFDIKYYLYKYLVNYWVADTREVDQLTFIKNAYQLFADYDRYTYNIPK